MWVSEAQDRFWRKVDMQELEPSTCWLWTAGRSQDGYGSFSVRGKKLLAHRVVYEWLVGSIPAGLHIDHLCRNRGCVNPAHMEPVTPGENVLRGETFAARNASVTHCPQGHEYAGDNLYVCPRGWRGCRECRRGTAR